MAKRPLRALSVFLVLLCAGGLAVWAGASPEKTQAKAPIVLTAFGATSAETDPITGGDPNNTPFEKALAKATGVTLRWVLVTPEDAQQ